MDLPALLQAYDHELVAGGITAGGWLISRLVNNRAKLIFHRNHAFTLLVEEPLHDAEGKVIQNKQAINTASLSFQNASRFPARSIEIVFNWRPQYWNMALTRAYQEEILPDGRYVIKMTDLAPREIITFELLSINSALPNLINFRSEDCVGEERQMHLVRQFPMSVNAAVACLLALGTFYAVLLAVNAFTGAS